VTSAFVRVSSPRRRRSARSWFALAAAALVLDATACAEILGDFSVAPGDAGGDGTTESGSDSGSDASVASDGRGGNDGTTDADSAEVAADSGDGDALGDGAVVRDSPADRADSTAGAEAGGDAEASVDAVAQADAAGDADAQVDRETGPSCSPASCPTGCCDSDGSCASYDAQSNTSCGPAGVACAPCASGISCDTTGGICLGCGGSVTLASGSSGDQFGSGVGLSGGTLIVGTPNAPGTNGGDAVYYTGSGTSWVAQGALQPSTGAAGANYGSWVGISGSTAAVGGAPGGTPTIAIFTQQTPTAWLAATSFAPANTGGYGPVFAIDGNTIVVGGLTAATVYTGSGATWTQQGPSLQPPDYSPNSSNLFGTKVAISGDTILVGGSPAQSGSGAVFLFGYVFVRTGTTWSYQAKLTPVGMTPNGSSNLRWSVGLNGATAAIAFNLGGYVFQQSGSSWPQTATLSNANDNDFGSAIAISGDGILVGSENLVGSNGNAYLFGRSNGTWIGWPTPLASNITPGPDGFGHAVALSGNTAVIGAFNASSAVVYPCYP
jgi:FG-GAP repeat